MKTLVAYLSKSGATKQYALWIHEASPESDLIDLRNINPNNLEQYDKIVIGSRTYMGRIQATRFLQKNWSVLKSKRVFLFAVGLIPAKSKASQASYEQIPQAIRSQLEGYIKIPGQIDLSRLNLIERLIIKSRKEPPAARAIDKKYIQPVLDFLK